MVPELMWGLASLAIVMLTIPVQVAADGLAYMHDTFEFGRDGKVTSLAEAMATITSRYAPSHIAQCLLCYCAMPTVLCDMVICQLHCATCLEPSSP